MANNKGGTGNVIKIAIMVTLLLICAGAIYMLYSKSQALNDLSAEKAQLQQNLKDLSDTLNVKKTEFDQLKGKNAELDSIIVVRETQIESQENQIAAILSKEKVTSEELANAKVMITNDEASISDFGKQLDDLTQKNKELKSQNEQLSNDLSTEKKTSHKLNEQNMELFTKGSLLQLKNITVMGIKTKKNGKEVTEKKAKKTESLKISFETGENKILQPGTVNLYVRIINPKGEVISVAEEGSGTISEASGTAIQYTKKVDLAWKQENMNMDVYWSQDISEPGVYTAEIYQNAHVVGKGTVELK